MTVELTPIGIVRADTVEPPRHWSVSDVEGTLDIDEAFAPGLRDVEPGQRIVVLFHFDRSPEFAPDHLIQMSGGAGREMGVFSTCSPIRPNPIGMSVLDVVTIEGAQVRVRGLDMLDGTPILDIKPYIEASRDKEPRR